MRSDSDSYAAVCGQGRNLGVFEIDPEPSPAGGADSSADPADPTDGKRPAGGALIAPPFAPPTKATAAIGHAGLASYIL